MSARAAIKLDELLAIRDALDNAIKFHLRIGHEVNDPRVMQLQRARSTLVVRFALDKLVEVDITQAQEVPQ